MFPSLDAEVVKIIAFLPPPQNGERNSAWDEGIRRLAFGMQVAGVQDVSAIIKVITRYRRDFNGGSIFEWAAYI